MSGHQIKVSGGVSNPAAVLVPPASSRHWGRRGGGSREVRTRQLPAGSRRYDERRTAGFQPALGRTVGDSREARTGQLPGWKPAVRLAGFQLALHPLHHRARDADMVHAGWRHRGYLPHFDGPGATQHVVFGLADAFPDESNAPEEQGARFRWREAVLHRGSGECLLRGLAAEAMEGVLLHFDGERYSLFAWCVMPNHVHALVATNKGWPLSRIVHSWKSFSANAVNKLAGRSGRLWRREYYDHFVRTNTEFDDTRCYIENNPVAAGLVGAPDEWRWSSAWAGRSVA